MNRRLTEEEVLRQLADLPGWTRAGEDRSSITARFELADFAAAMSFVNQVARAAEQMDHHPDIDIRYDRVTLVLSTHSAGGLTQLDIELAHRVLDDCGLASSQP